MKLFFYFVAAGLLTTPLVAHGQLGITMAECEARYGKPSADHYGDGDLPGEKTALFTKDGMVMTTSFLQGKVVRFSYSKFTAGAAPLSKDVINKCLEENQGGLSWIAGKEDDTFARWKRTDGAEALYAKGVGSLGFEDSTYVAAMKRLKEERPKQRGDVCSNL